MLPLGHSTGYYRLREVCNQYSNLPSCFFLDGQSDAVELLIENGASVNLQNYQQMAALHYAAMQPFSTALQMLLAG